MDKSVFTNPVNMEEEVKEHVPGEPIEDQVRTGISANGRSHRVLMNHIRANRNRGLFPH